MKRFFLIFMLGALAGCGASTGYQSSYIISHKDDAPVEASKPIP